jgi:hypothetical protein
METPLEKWTNIGVLEFTPDDRKEAVANALEFAYKILIEKQNNDVNFDAQLETIPFPIISRIVREIDLTEEEILEIIKTVIPEAKKAIKAMLIENDYFGAMDYESMFAVNYIQNYLLKHKKS